MANKNVTGEVLEQNYELQKKFNEFHRQINQKTGYPFDFETLISNLQNLVDGKFFENKIFKKDSNFISELFQKTNLVLVKKKLENFVINEASIMDFLKPVMDAERKKGNPTPFIDKNIWKYFLGEFVSGIKRSFKSVIYRFTKTLTHQQILEESEKIHIKNVYSFFEGLSIICQVVLNGEVEKKGTGIIVYFKMKNNNNLYRFEACRNDDGQLYLFAIKVYLGLELYADFGACFRN